jgi:hypothetical protein
MIIFAPTSIIINLKICQKVASTIKGKSHLYDKHQITKSIGWQEMAIGLA